MSATDEGYKRSYCRIGGQPVKLVTDGALPNCLTRLGILESSSTPDFAVTLRIDVTEKCDWDLGSLHKGSVYVLGRPSHHIILDCSSGDIHFRIPKDLNPADLYWFQRDLFACLGSLSTDPVLHSSAVVHDGKGYLFCASSGIGKSTVARLLSRHATIVNDETNWLVRGEDGDYALVNQPFWFSEGTPMPSVPVRGIYLLERAETCSIIPCTLTAEAFSLLLAVHLPLDSTDPFLAERSARIVQMVREVPLYTLRFYRDTNRLEGVLYDR